jgi:hypothetical protein
MNRKEARGGDFAYRDGWRTRFQRGGEIVDTEAKSFKEMFTSLTTGSQSQPEQPASAQEKLGGKV